jgi:hypothetical protein
MAWISPLRSFGIALLVLAFVWVLTTAMAYLAIRNRQFDTHKEWMLRSYVVTYGFSIFRLLDELQFFQSLGNERFATIAWVCWTIPLMMTEVGLQWKRTMAR